MSTALIVVSFGFFAYVLFHGGPKHGKDDAFGGRT